MKTSSVNIGIQVIVKTQEPPYIDKKPEVISLGEISNWQVQCMQELHSYGDLQKK